MFEVILQKNEQTINPYITNDRAMLYGLLFLFPLGVVGLVTVILIAKVLLVILPGAVIGFLVWLLTGSLLLAEVAFIVVSLRSLARR